MMRVAIYSAVVVATIIAATCTQDSSKSDGNDQNFKHKPNNDSNVAAKSHVATLLSTSVIARSVVILCLYIYIIIFMIINSISMPLHGALHYKL